ncbi:hypothetical protein RJ640_015174 [Escallonia rubra]|uniref:Uncharacterized protein n=1 Tax=Escallonia rubra TaxID=112253 RepID=A0AA88SL29_9ASTE|nr:hypothetical protein RJ640_015174 [Escallonia rubra]
MRGGRVGRRLRLAEWVWVRAEGGVGGRRGGDHWVRVAEGGRQKGPRRMCGEGVRETEVGALGGRKMWAKVGETGWAEVWWLKEGGRPQDRHEGRALGLAERNTENAQDVTRATPNFATTTTTTSLSHVNSARTAAGTEQNGAPFEIFQWAVATGKTQRDIQTLSVPRYRLPPQLCCLLLLNLSSRQSLQGCITHRRRYLILMAFWGKHGLWSELQIGYDLGPSAISEGSTLVGQAVEIHRIWWSMTMMLRRLLTATMLVSSRCCGIGPDGDVGTIDDCWLTTATSRHGDCSTVVMPIWVIWCLRVFQPLAGLGIRMHLGTFKVMRTPVILHSHQWENVQSVISPILEIHSPTEVVHLLAVSPTESPTVVPSATDKATSAFGVNKPLDPARAPIVSSSPVAAQTRDQATSDFTTNELINPVLVVNAPFDPVHVQLLMISIKNSNSYRQLSSPISGLQQRHQLMLQMSMQLLC